MSWYQEFKEFAFKGNMVELAIGVIIGLAFGKVVSSLVSDIIMPPIGILLGGVNFSNLALKLPGSGTPPPEIKYGLFINNLIDFLIVAVVVFLLIKAINKLRATPPPISPNTKICPECQMDIPNNAKKCGHCCSMLN